MTNDCNYLIKMFCESSYSQAYKDAIAATNSYIEKLNLGFNVQDNIILLLAELSTINQIIINFPQKAYIQYCSNKEWLCKFFATRILLHGVNDSKSIQAAFLLFHKKNKLEYLLSNEIDKAPHFSSKDFLNCYNNYLFYDLNLIPPGMNERDMLQCRSIQAKLILNATLHNLNKIQTQFLKSLAKTKNQSILFAEEDNNLLCLYKSALKENEFDLTKSLSFLHGFKNIEIDNIDALNANLVKQFLKKSPNHYGLKYSQLIDYSTIESNIIDCSIPEILALTLIKYGQWISHCRTKKIYSPSIIDKNINDHFEKVYCESIKQSGMLHFSFNQRNLGGDNQDEAIFQIQNIIEGLRKRFNSLGDPIYFQNIRRKDFTSAYYIDRSLVGNINEQNNFLQEAIILYEEIVIYNNELIKSNANVFQSADKYYYIKQRFGILSDMAISTNLSGGLEDAFSEFICFNHDDSLITFLATKNLNYKLNTIFVEAINTLTSLLKSKPGEIVKTYLIPKLATLKSDQLQATLNNKSISKNISFLIEVLKIQKEAVNYLGTLHASNIQRLIDPSQQKESTNLSFGFNKSNALFLEPIITALTVQIDLLDESKTSVKDFIHLITSNDLSKETNSIHFGCQTNELSYILKKLKPFFKSLTPTKIEESKLFLSNKGNLITAANLYNTNFNNLKNKVKIDNIFNLTTNKNT